MWQTGMYYLTFQNKSAAYASLTDLTAYIEKEPERLYFFQKNINSIFWEGGNL